jgi:hypothetical protein
MKLITPGPAISAHAKTSKVAGFFGKVRIFPQNLLYGIQDWCTKGLVSG